MRVPDAKRRTLLAAVATLPLVGTLRAAPDRALATRPVPSTGEALPRVGLGTWITFNIGATARRATHAPRCYAIS